jgi:UDP-N-acetylglucosamine diphosphorylase / glucose-1-phosphate thymidylyltransferase / UDP-N-acetylgalactosamine diphosphorylase / glucosamine-1-phosphate N-acetyltransferase / galactosamine-1-phosphate N-acetyltransferase
MNKIIFTSEYCQPENLHPFTLTRQVQDIRIGILTIRQKWERMLGLLSVDKNEIAGTDHDVCYRINAAVLPASALVKATRKLKAGECITDSNGTEIVFFGTKEELIKRHETETAKAIISKEPIQVIRYPWHIFQLNDWAIRQDFDLLTAKRKTQPISKTNTVIKPSQIFIEKGAKVEHSIINASTGPVYIGKNAEVMEGCIIRGPFVMGEGACLKMGTKVYGATTLGPGCVVGGEIKNSVLFGYSNKAHDGYLGDSVVGEWCNMGAGTTNSNLKNTASDIRVWTLKGEINAGMKCGVMLGDYSRTAVNTTINTGTVIGVCSNVFGTELTPKYIPSFSWGSGGLTRYDFDKALIDIEGWKKLKGQSITEEERSILKFIFDIH